MRPAILIAAVALGACNLTVPEAAFQLGPDSLGERLVQTRRFETTDEPTLLAAVASFLQDQGYTIENSETALGVLYATKIRLIGGWLDRILTAESQEEIRASAVTRPSDQKEGGTLVRITFQRIVVDDLGRVLSMETVADPKIYQEVFDALSQSVFLTAHQL
jgi:hypothetical protein